MKQFIFAGVLLFIGSVVVLPSSAALADGGMMIVAVETDADVLVTLKPSPSQQITYLKTLISLYSQVQALQLDLPAATESDEGILSVVINESMQFPCEGKAMTAGERCVRHVGDLGESYIDLDQITGFIYDERFAMTLTLQRNRAATNGEESSPQYDYALLNISDIAYQQ